jgi:hypothetical protein
MKLYIAGKITGDDDYLEKFNRAALRMRLDGHIIMSPACLPYGFSWDDYMHVCRAMIDVCDGVLFLADWTESRGAREEHEYATDFNKLVMYDDQKDVCSEQN